jgi:K+-sensing histidine kinase KdpD
MLRGETMPLLENDSVLMDKFKMDQVLRNLVSNALKFTPRQGQVSIYAVFKANHKDLTDSINNIDEEKKNWMNHIFNIFNVIIFKIKNKKIHVAKSSSSIGVLDVEANIEKDIEDGSIVYGKLVLTFPPIPPILPP